MIILDQFGIIQNLQMSPIPKPSILVGTFFAISYSKTAQKAYFTVLIHTVLKKCLRFHAFVMNLFTQKFYLFRSFLGCTFPK